MASDRAQTLDGLQGLAALVGITLGAVPLVQVLLGGSPGLLRFILGGSRDTAAYLVPSAVLAVAVVAITVLECSQRRRSEG